MAMNWLNMVDNYLLRRPFRVCGSWAGIIYRRKIEFQGSLTALPPVLKTPEEDVGEIWRAPNLAISMFCYATVIH